MRRFHLLFILSLAAAGLTAVRYEPDKARVHFFETIDKLLKLNYEIVPVDQSPTSMLQMYIIKESNEHVIDIEVVTQPSGALSLEFKRSKKDPVYKDFAEYHTEEIEMQSKAIRELIKRMPQVNIRGSNKLFFNTIADVKQKLSALASPKDRLSFNQVFKNGRLEMQLLSQESLLGLFEITVDGSRDPEYDIVVDFTISYNNKEESSSITIPVFQEKTNSFDLIMSTITSKLELAKYINNNADGLAQLGSFVKTNFKSLAFSEKPAESRDDLKVFELKFEKQTARGVMTYSPPGQGQKLGSYKVEIFRGDQLHASVEYKRMSYVSLVEEFRKLRLEALFEGLWEKVKRIYKARYDQHLKDVYPKAEWKDSVSKPALWSDTENVLTLELNQQVLMRLGLTKLTTNAKLKWTSPKPGFKYIKYDFHPDEFSPEVLENHFNMIFEGYAWLLQSERQKAV